MESDGKSFTESPSYFISWIGRCPSDVTCYGNHWDSLFIKRLNNLITIIMLQFFKYRCCIKDWRAWRVIVWLEFYPRREYEFFFFFFLCVTMYPSTGFVLLRTCKFASRYIRIPLFHSHFRLVPRFILFLWIYFTTLWIHIFRTFLFFFRYTTFRVCALVFVRARCLTKAYGK